MTYLVAQMLAMLVLAGFFGFMLGRWWIRRQFEDVTETHARLLERADADYGPRLDALQAELRQLGASMADTVQAQLEAKSGSIWADLGPLEAAVETLNRQVSARPEPADADLSFTHERLQAIEAQLHRLVQREGGPSADPFATPAVAPALFDRPEHGAPDDLKLISGVGPKLERLLNQLGVWYFWQIASWSEGEIRHVDARLAAFKGRIQRDHWVEQAIELAASSERQPPEGEEPLSVLPSSSRPASE